jgi:DNA-binding GntR family transcriptional regulator
MQCAFVYKIWARRYAPAHKDRKKEQGAEEMSVEGQIYERIYGAIIEQRLPPGTKLGEESLCELFGVSRSRIRKVLYRLGNESVVVLVPNRGAFVARPSVQEAREVFATRRLLEAEVVRGLARGLPVGDASRLARHVELEREAHGRHDRRASIRLSGEFHLLLAELAGNRVIERFLRELVSRTSLIIAVYEAPGRSCCSFDEHGALIEAIGGGRGEAAVEGMMAHLCGVEGRLMLERPPRQAVDLKAVFAPPEPDGPAAARAAGGLAPARRR